MRHYELEVGGEGAIAMLWLDTITGKESTESRQVATALYLVSTYGGICLSRSGRVVMLELSSTLDHADFAPLKDNIAATLVDDQKHVEKCLSHKRD